MIMVAMPTLEQLKNSKIDTVERAIVWASSLLRVSNLNHGSGFPHYKSIRVTSTLNQKTNPDLGLLKLEIKLPYNSQLMMLSGFDFLNAIEPFSNNELPSFNYQCPATDDGHETLKFPNDSIINLEQYLYWVCSILYASIDLKNENISFIFLEENETGAIVKFLIHLPFDYNLWVQSRNLISSLQRIVNNYSYPINSYLVEHKIDNTTPFDNLLLVGN